MPLLLIIGYVWPEPGSSAAGSRMLQLIRFFQSEGFAVTFASPAAHSEFAINLYSIGVTPETIRLNCSSFDDFIREIRPDVVLFDRFMMEEQFGWRVARYCPDAIRILDTEDLHCLREARRLAYKRQTDYREELVTLEIAKREIASIFRSDLTLMISEFEMELLVNNFKVDPAIIHYIPLLVDSEQSSLVPFEERKNFVFIGNFFHEPNWNCVKVLKNEIWPVLKEKVPEATMQIYGAYATQKVTDLHNPKERFWIMGRADDAKEVITNARVLLAPIRFGAGIKGKLLEAMLYGTPTVTTTIGAESMQDNGDWNGYISDDAAAFIANAATLYSDSELWNRKQQNGYRIVKARYTAKWHLEALKQRLHDLQHDLKQHRQANFIGAMLQHHSMQSTHYMAKWIAEKNKATQ
ncbi:glycosyltransferase family 4 protein [Flavobacterium cerinum]|uniref:Glycosyltransferase family 4 protein n=1 Tax=Flavobacterium cerinum TaxID=2502784 RepID=A0ABY5IXZ6_9FLAO|nr:glycosyltransferase family 4 protein [Flavobacterium cerinum]UUC47336.1 glycosyltransferase family 4 protein [Flavobacterium cerinum]